MIQETDALEDIIITDEMLDDRTQRERLTLEEREARLNIRFNALKGITSAPTYNLARRALESVQSGIEFTPEEAVRTRELIFEGLAYASDPTDLGAVSDTYAEIARCDCRFGTSAYNVIQGLAVTTDLLTKPENESDDMQNITNIEGHA